MVIDKNYGEEIINTLKNTSTPEAKSLSESVVLSFTNPIQKREKTELRMIVTPLDRSAYVLMAEFHPIARSLGYKLDFDLLFRTWSCQGCDEDTINWLCLTKKGEICQSDGKSPKITKMSFFLFL